MNPQSNNGLAHLTSVHSVDEVLQRLLTLLKERSIPVFAIIDHSGEALKVGLQMQPTILVIFGNPKAGTPIMLASPDSAIDLPLKILIAEDSKETTRVSYNTVDYLGDRFSLSPAETSPLAAIEQIAKAITS